MESNQFKSGFVALVGPANAGKSTLINAMLGEKVSIVSPKAHTTRNRILGIKNLAQAQVVFVDTPGFVEFRSPKNKTQKKRKSSGMSGLSNFLRQSLVDATTEVDLRVLVIDSELIAKGKKTLRQVFDDHLSYVEKAPQIIVLNKIDLFDRLQLLPLITELDQLSQGVSGFGSPEIIPLSALKKDGLDILLSQIIKLLPTGSRLFPQDMVTDQSDKFLAAEVVREKLFYRLQQELPYSAAVKIENWQDQGELLRIDASIIVERDSQKGIVVGAGGRMIKEIGQAARLELEEIFICKVFLGLTVKVEQDWTTNETGFRKVGIGNY